MLSKQQCNDLYRKHAPGAFRRAQRLLANSSDADDVVHDVFLTLFERHEQYRGASSISTYVYSAITHACLNRLRNRRRRAGLARAQLFVKPSYDPGGGPEAWAAARSLLERLPEQLAEVTVYHYLDELSQREIASILGCSHTHVAELIARLSRWIGQQEPSEYADVERTR
jgi:RNA polymerase sigma-70 factor (ECF subfamily)